MLIALITGQLLPIVLHPLPLFLRPALTVQPRLVWTRAAPVPTLEWWRHTNTPPLCVCTWTCESFVLVFVRCSTFTDFCSITFQAFRLFWNAPKWRWTRICQKIWIGMYSYNYSDATHQIIGFASWNVCSVLVWTSAACKQSQSPVVAT